MLFLLQKENKKYDLDNFILRNLIEENKYIHRFIDMSLNDFYDEKKQLKTIELFPKEYKEAIPLGTIQFVNAYFQTFFHLTMNALEIPKVLLKDEFLKRKYSIRVADDIPTKGNYFIKDATELKRFSYEGELEYLFYDGIFEEEKGNVDTKLHLDKTHLYQVSELVNVLSE